MAAAPLGRILLYPCHIKPRSIRYDPRRPNLAVRGAALQFNLRRWRHGVWANRSGLAANLKQGVATVSFGAGGASYNWASRGHTLSVGGEAMAGTELRYAENRKTSPLGP